MIHQSAPILTKLPDELLLEIITAATAWPDNPDELTLAELYADRWPLPLVCCRFYGLVTPILYSRITLGHRLADRDSGTRSWNSWPTARESMLLLHRSLKANPGLGSLCTELVVDIAGCARHPQHHDALLQLLASFPNTRSLRLHDGFAQDHMLVTMSCRTSALDNMPLLEHLAFTAGHISLGPMFLLALLSTVNVNRYPQLKSLRMVGIGSDSMPIAFRNLGNRGWCPFTELTMGDFSERSDTTSALLRMPTRLERFTLLGTSQPRYNEIDMGWMWPSLLVHATSLEYLCIGSVSNHPWAPPFLEPVDLTPFECLTFVSLSYWATGTVSDVGDLMPPSLETFEWTFDREDGGQTHLDQFQQFEEEFIRKYANEAIRREIPLRKINVVFTPIAAVRPEEIPADDHDYSTIPQTARGLQYPWDRLEKLKSEIRSKAPNIELTYNTPSVTRVEYETAVLESPRLYNLPEGYSDSPPPSEGI